MAWGLVAAGVSAAASLGGAAMSASASRRAGEQAAQSASAASAAEQDAARRALDLQREQYRNAWGLLAPAARDGRRAQSYVNSILYGGRGATPGAAVPKGTQAGKPAPTGSAGAEGAAAATPAPTPDWDAYEAQWRPTTLNNPTSPFFAYLAAHPDKSWGENFYDWSGGRYGAPQMTDYADTNQAILDQYGDLMGDTPTADLGDVMGDYRNTPMYQMSEDAIAADTAASDLATSKALEEFMHRAGASGSAISGNALRGTADIRNEYGVGNAQSAAARRASTFGGWFDQLQGQAGIGRDATSGMVSGGQTFTNNASNLITSQGDSAARAITAAADARARGQLGAAQAWGNGINGAITGVTSAWDIYNRSKTPTPVATPTTANIQNAYWKG